MTDEISDSMTERRQRAMSIRVKEGAPLDVSLFLDRRPAMTRFALEMMERATRLMHCPGCIIEHPLPRRHFEYSFMFTAFEDDPLQSFWKMATNTCAHCGMEETLALDTPDFSVPWADPVPMVNAVYRESTDVWELAAQRYKAKEEMEHIKRQAAFKQNMQAGALAQYGGVLNSGHYAANSLSASLARHTHEMQQTIDRDIFEAMSMPNKFSDNKAKLGVLQRLIGPKK